MNLNMQLLDQTILHINKTLQWKWIPYGHSDNPKETQYQRDRELGTIKKKRRVAVIQSPKQTFNSKDILFSSDLGIILDFDSNKSTKKLVEGFVGKSSYVMGSINSIALHNNLIYDLLDPVDSKGKKMLVKCRCSQSKCKAGYCECFSRGLSCGITCECTNCQNLVAKDPMTSTPQPEQKGCKCQRSHCNKKYCECLKDGNKCGQKCQCVDCHNI